MYGFYFCIIEMSLVSSPFFLDSNLITVMFFIWHFFWEMAFIFNLRNGFQSWSLRSLSLQNSGYKVIPSKFRKCYWFFPPGNFYCTKFRCHACGLLSHVGVLPSKHSPHEIAVYWFVSVLVCTLYEKRSHLCFIFLVLSPVPGTQKLMY